MKIPALLAATLVLAGCATPEARLRAGLEDAGLSQSMAACMARQMTRQLSITQLRRIGDLPSARDAESVDAFLHRVRALRDPEILSVTTAAAAGCATGLAR